MMPTHCPLALWALPIPALIANPLFPWCIIRMESPEPTDPANISQVSGILGQGDWRWQPRTQVQCLGILRNNISY